MIENTGDNVLKIRKNLIFTISNYSKLIVKTANDSILI